MREGTTEKTEVGGLKITTMKLPPRRAFKLGSKLLKYALPVLGGMDPEAKLGTAEMSQILTLIVRDMDEDQLDELLCQSLVATTVIRSEGKGKPEKFELHDPDAIDAAFAGKLGAMLETFQWVLKFNFGDFFSDESANGRAEATATDSST